MNNSKTKNTEIKEIEKQNKKIFIIFLVVIASLLIFLGVTFAAFNYEKLGTNPNVFQTGTLILTFDESKGDAITVNKAVPVSDAVGESTDPYTFTLENTGTLNADYRLKIIYNETAMEEDNCTNKQLEFSKVKYNLVKNETIQDSKLLSSVSEQIIDSGTLKPNEVNEYELRLWVDQDAGVEINGKHFHVVVRVESVQEGRDDYPTS